MDETQAAVIAALHDNRKRAADLIEKLAAADKVSGDPMRKVVGELRSDTAARLRGEPGQIPKDL
jgi:hypothetical protein